VRRKIHAESGGGGAAGVEMRDARMDSSVISYRPGAGAGPRKRGGAGERV